MKRLKTKSFWVGLAGAVMLILQAFGLKINAPVVNEVISSLCAIAILFGVMVDDTKKSTLDTNVSDQTLQTPKTDTEQTTTTSPTTEVATPTDTEESASENK
jgi:uncharacterized membrane protein